jgi:hypothetical protein
MLKTSALKATLISGALAIFAFGPMTGPAQAMDGHNAAAAAAAGVVGGIGAGAAIGAAASQPHQYYVPPVRERRVVVAGDEDCVVRTRRVYVNGVMRVRRETVCR